MKIYPETRAALTLFQDWATIKSVAEKLRIRTNGLNARLGTMLKAGLVERRAIGVAKSRPDKSWHYEYKITSAGSRTAFPRLYEPDPEPVEQTIYSNAFHWRTFVQPVPMKLGKREQQPRPDQAVNTRFTQYD